MHINDFEDEIEKKILDRGKEYFAIGAIDELWQESNGDYCAVVDGTEPYEVMVSLNNKGMIVEHFCDCPYEWGAFCKHEVAVLFAIQEYRANRKKLPNKRRKAPRGLKDFLGKHKKQDLIGLICMLSREYNLREEIEHYFEDEDDGWEEED